MKITTTHCKIAVLALLLATGCSKQASQVSTEDSDSDPPITSKKELSDVDKMCEEVLQSSDKMEAADWVKRYPKSAVGEDEDGKQILLAPFVARFRDAGAQRIVIETATLGQGEFLVGMVVVLPKDAPARQKIFALEPEMSQLCQQTPVTDKGQKYLHYGFD